MSSPFNFFNLAGYLFPGITFLALLALPLVHIESIHRIINTFYENLSKANSFPATVALTTAFALPTISIVFSVGVFTSELYTLLMRITFFHNWNSNTFEEDSVYAKLLVEKNVDDVLSKNWGVREALVLSHISPSHLYESSGRARLLGASGFALLLAGLFYWIPYLTLLYQYRISGVCFCIVGGLMILLAYSRHKMYNEFVDINAFVYHKILKKPDDAPTCDKVDVDDKKS